MQKTLTGTKTLILPSLFNQPSPPFYHNHNKHGNLYWYMMYLKEHYIKPEKTRTIILINKQIATNSWLQFNFHSPNVTVVQVQTVAGNAIVINTHNYIMHANSISSILQVM